MYRPVDRHTAPPAWLLASVLTRWKRCPYTLSCSGSGSKRHSGTRKYLGSVLCSRNTILRVSISSQNIVQAVLGSSLTRTGVTTSVAAHCVLPSNTLLKDPMKALSLGQHTQNHNHSEKALAHKPAVR